MLREESFNSFEDRGGTEGAAPLDSTSLDFVKTDVKNMNLDDVQKRIHSMEERNVTRYASVHRQSSLEETEDEIWMRRVQLCVSKLTMLDPARRAHKANLYRYENVMKSCYSCGLYPNYTIIQIFPYLVSLFASQSEM